MQGSSTRRTVVSSEAISRMLRRFFHWQYSGVLIPALFGAGLALALDRDFRLAYLTFSIFGVWCVGFWATHEFIHEKYLYIGSKHALLIPSFKGKALIEYCVWLFGGILVFSAITGVSIYLTFQKQIETELQSMNGVLYPANEPIPRSPCALSGSELGIFLPNGFGAKSSRSSLTLISVEPQRGKRIPVLVLNRKPDGSITLYVDVRDETGKVIVRLNESGYYVNPNNILSMERKDRSSLSVTDQYGNEVLSVRYLNYHSIYLQANLNVNGINVDLNKFPLQNICLTQTDLAETVYNIGPYSQ